MEVNKAEIKQSVIIFITVVFILLLVSFKASAAEIGTSTIPATLLPE